MGLENTDEIKALEKQIKKLTRENKRLRHDCEMLHSLNEQVTHIQGYIQRENQKQILYNGQLLKSSPNILVMTNESLETIMASDVFCRLSGKTKDEVKEGLGLYEAFSNIIPKEDLEGFIDACKDCLAKKEDISYLMDTVVDGAEKDFRVELSFYMDEAEELKGLNILFEDMTEFVKAMERAENADKEKSNFLANMSHEIRTPMNAINGMAEFILRDSTDAATKENAAMIKSASNSLLAIINDILDFSKIESGKMELIEDSYRMSSLIRDVATMIDIRLQNKNVTLELAVSDSLPDAVYGDEVRMKQILINILNNAVKFTTEGSITLFMDFERISESSCKLMVKISDTGIGIKPEDLQNIFSSFTQVDTKRNRSIEGTGLGLAICRKLIKMMDGELSVASEYGKGSTFSFSVVTTVEDWKPVGDIENTLQNTPVKAFKVDFSAPNAKVLVVDDNQMNLKVAAGLLKPYGILPDCAASGQESILLAQQKRYDLIFMDHMMPVMDGVGAMQEIRRLEGGKEFDIIALTANALTGMAEKYISLGFNDFLAKPISPPDMDQILRKHLSDDLIRKETDMEVLEFPADGSFSEEVREEEAGSQEQEMERIKCACPKIDLNCGMEHCMGDWKFYKEILTDYVRDTKEGRLADCYKIGDLKNYEILVHALKSSSKTIGLTELGAQAYELETAAKEGNIQTIQEGHGRLLENYQQAVREIKEGLDL